MIITEEKKKKYISWVHEEMQHRGLTDKEIARIIAKTGFMQVMDEYLEEQLHYDPKDAVNEILLTAAKA